MSGIDLAEDVEAATRELHALRCCDGAGPLACTPDEMTEDEDNAINVIRAALPLVEQQIRAQIAVKALREAAEAAATGAATIAAIGAATIAALTALQPAQWIDWDEQATNYPDWSES